MKDSFKNGSADSQQSELQQQELREKILAIEIGHTIVPQGDFDSALIVSVSGDVVVVETRNGKRALSVRKDLFKNNAWIKAIVAKPEDLN
jgi:hypothetical protein